MKHPSNTRIDVAHMLNTLPHLKSFDTKDEGDYDVFIDDTGSPRAFPLNPSSKVIIPPVGTLAKVEYESLAGDYEQHFPYGWNVSVYMLTTLNPCSDPIYLRETPDGYIVERYAHWFEKGHQCPPIAGFWCSGSLNTPNEKPIGQYYDAGDRFWVNNGHHRIEAARLANIEVIHAWVPVAHYHWELADSLVVWAEQQLGLDA